MMENLSSLVKEIKVQVQEAQRFPVKMNPKRPSKRYIIIKMPKVKDGEFLKQQEKHSYLPTMELHKTVS